MRPRVSRWIVAISVGILAVLTVLDGAQAQRAASTSALSDLETAVIRALAMNPETAPYPIRTSLKEGRLRLSGVVGTKHAHDVAIRTVMAITPSIDDEIVIDTAATILAAGAAGGMGGMGGYAGSGYPGRPTMGNVPYTYPPPLFGYYDDPFYGFEPPIVSYPPWWNAMSAARLAPRREMMPPRAMAPPVAEAPQPAVPAQPPAALPGAAPVGGNDSFEMTIDANGVATLRGEARNPAERAEIERRIARTPGVAGVVNELTVSNPGTGNPEVETVPPPPRPGIPRLLDPRSARPTPVDDSLRSARPPPVDDSLKGRVTSAIRRRPGLENAAVRVEEQGGRVALSGQVPDVYEAMMAFRAAEQTPGVNEVSDRLGFEVPRPGAANPLIEKGSPEDVEPYLKAQIQRQSGEQVHIDRVTVQGDELEVQGTLSDAGDKARIEAILRSMPILRGYQVRPVFRVN